MMFTSYLLINMNLTYFFFLCSIAFFLKTHYVTRKARSEWSTVEVNIHTDNTMRYPDINILQTGHKKRPLCHYVLYQDNSEYIALVISHRYNLKLGKSAHPLFKKLLVCVYLHPF